MRLVMLAGVLHRENSVVFADQGLARRSNERTRARARCYHIGGHALSPEIEYANIELA
jgi:hypothetical protein